MHECGEGREEGWKTSKLAKKTESPTSPPATHLLQQGQLLHSIQFQQLGTKYSNIRAYGGGVLTQTTTGVLVLSRAGPPSAIHVF